MCGKHGANLDKVKQPPWGGGGRNTRNVSSGKLGKSCVITQACCRSGLGLQRSASPRGKGQQVLGVEASHAQCVEKF